MFGFKFELQLLDEKFSTKIIKSIQSFLCSVGQLFKFTCARSDWLSSFHLQITTNDQQKMASGEQSASPTPCDKEQRPQDNGYKTTNDQVFVVLFMLACVYTV